MITIPFYNHHFHDNETARSVNNVFSAAGSRITELPCLCKYSSPYNPNDRQIAIIHGARREDVECYRKINEQISANPNTLFYLWAINFDLDEKSHELFNTENCPKNCKLITNKSVADIVEEVKAIFKESK